MMILIKLIGAICTSFLPLEHYNRRGLGPMLYTPARPSFR